MALGAAQTKVRFSQKNGKRLIRGAVWPYERHYCFEVAGLEVWKRRLELGDCDLLSRVGVAVHGASRYPLALDSLVYFVP